jgi:hypothetical protein
MKAKLIKTDVNYLLEDNKGVVIGSTSTKEINKLSKQNCDEIFGVVDVDKLAIEYDLYEKINFVGQTRAYKAGFNKAIELNKDKEFTEGKLRRAMSMVIEKMDSGESFTKSEIIDSLRQPTEIEVEIEMKKVVDETKVIGAVKRVKGSGDKITTYKSIPKLDDNGCLILKRAK